MYFSFICPMKIPHPRKLILTAALPLLTPSCDSNRGQSRETQLEKTALELETKAEEILDQTQETAAAKENQATKILQENGSEEIAQTLQKDAETTLEAGKIRAEQLEKQAQEIRKQTEEPQPSPPTPKP